MVRITGQAVVQIAEDSFTREQFAVKFFLSKTAFSQEAKLYKDPEQPLGRFLPECRMIMDPTTGIGCTDKRGHALPPFIVMEKGESLDRWAARSEDGLDFVTGLQVRTPYKTSLLSDFQKGNEPIHFHSFWNCTCTWQVLGCWVFFCAMRIGAYGKWVIQAHNKFFLCRL